MIIYDNNILRLSGLGALGVWTENLANIYKQQMLEGKRENCIATTPEAAKQNAINLLRRYNSTFAKWDELEKVHTKALQERESLRAEINRLRNSGQSSAANSYESLFKAAELNEEMRYKDLKKLTEELTDLEIYMYIMYENYNQLIGKTQSYQEYLDFQRKFISPEKGFSPNDYDLWISSLQDDIKTEDEKVEQQKRAEEKKKKEEQEEFNKRYLQTATNEEEETNFGKIAALAAALGLGILIFKGSKKKKKSKR